MNMNTKVQINNDMEIETEVPYNYSKSKSKSQTKKRHSRRERDREREHAPERRRRRQRDEIQLINDAPPPSAAAAVTSSNHPISIIAHNHHHPPPTNNSSSSNNNRYSKSISSSSILKNASSYKSVPRDKNNNNMIHGRSNKEMIPRYSVPVPAASVTKSMRSDDWHVKTIQEYGHHPQQQQKNPEWNYDDPDTNINIHDNDNDINIHNPTMFQLNGPSWDEHDNINDNDDDIETKSNIPFKEKTWHGKKHASFYVVAVLLGLGLVGIAVVTTWILLEDEGGEGTSSSVVDAEPEYEDDSKVSVSPSLSPDGDIATMSPTISSTAIMVPVSDPISNPNAPITIAPTPNREFSVSFYVFGDIGNEREVIERQLESEIDYNHIDFGVFLGNFQDIGSGCDIEYYKSFYDVLSKSQVPIFLTLGNSDWYDCNESNNVYWYNQWLDHFMTPLPYEQQFWADDPMFAIHQVVVNRQKNKLPSRECNFCFEYGGVLFIGSHLTGTYQSFIRDEREWKSRLDDARDFVSTCIETHIHDDHEYRKVRAAVLFTHARPQPVREVGEYFQPIVDYLNWLELPSLFIHGDGLVFGVSNGTFMKDVYGADDSWVMQVDAGHLAPPITINVANVPSGSSNEIFTYDRNGGLYD